MRAEYIIILIVLLTLGLIIYSNNTNDRAVSVRDDVINRLEEDKILRLKIIESQKKIIKNCDEINEYNEKLIAELEKKLTEKENDCNKLLEKYLEAVSND